MYLEDVKKTWIEFLVTGQFAIRVPRWLCCGAFLPFRNQRLFEILYLWFP